MLTALSIKNIVLVESLNLELSKGLCALTGETGAGKSILLGALGFVLGEKARGNLLRHGESQGSVTAVFDISSNNILKEFLKNNDIETEDDLILRRVVTEDGKNKAYINDSPSSVSMLSEVGDFLIEIHGQHDQKGLLNPASHMHILDEYGRLNEQAAEVASAYREYNNIEKRLKNLHEEKQKAAAEQDFLSHALAELKSLDPQEGEEEKLAEKRALFMNKEKLLDIINDSMNALSGNNSAEESLRNAQNLLIRNNALHEKFSVAADSIERAFIEINEASSILEEIADSMGFDEDTLDKVEEKLFALRAASRKYHRPVDQLQNYISEIEEKLNVLHNFDKSENELKAAYKKARDEYVKLAEKLSQSRKKAAISLENELHKELAPLKMENTKFHVDITASDESGWSASGFDKISFVASTNPGMPFSQLTKIASGGELSRFMLAMKVVLSEVKSVPTLIFDEVDTGIGGAVADSVGRRLAMLGKKAQVIVVTHQPQVASKASLHMKISKTTKDDKTTSSVKTLSDNERKEEIARMLSGENITEEARAAASKLMELVA